MDFEITFEPNLSKEDYEIVDGGLVEHLVVETGLSAERLHAEAFAFLVRIQDKVKAGIVGRIQDQTALFDTLWVDESLRRQGVGRRLLNEAETFAKNKGCTTVFLNTLSLENVVFYEKCGSSLSLLGPSTWVSLQCTISEKILGVDKDQATQLAQDGIHTPL